MIKTFSPKPAEVDREWFIVDAAGLTVGRLSTQIARVLIGKHKPQYARHVDVGDFVIVVNAEQVVFTGNKEEDKIYHSHSTYVGGLKSETVRQLRARRPRRIIEKAVWGMLPKTKLGRRQYKKLKVYAGTEHPHAAQQPKPLTPSEA